MDSIRRVFERTGSVFEVRTRIYFAVRHADSLSDDCHLTYTVSIPNPDLRAVMPYLIKYESSTQMARFSQTSYSCQICLTSIKGARCFLLSCSHVFCRSCLEDFWKLCIAEGEISRVGCPDPKCVKEGREANEEEVRRVVTEEEVRRWKWLREKRMHERGASLCGHGTESCVHNDYSRRSGNGTLSNVRMSGSGAEAVQRR